MVSPPRRMKMDSEDRLKNLINKTKSVVEDIRAKEDAATEARQAAQKIEQARKNRWSGEVRASLDKAVKKANDQLKAASLSPIQMTASQGGAHMTIQFVMKSEFQNGHLSSVASLTGDKIVVQNSRPRDRAVISAKEYQIDNVDAELIIEDIIEVFLKIQESLR